ncbi:MAG: hypothetical protein N2378_01925 [Chloroflexaceae bacterium]|nr:hypothetical protein [Chloroflexaceae bacterium]
MAQYRLATLDLSTRLALTLEMLMPRAARGWGRVTELAAAHQISRTRLYELRACGQAALLAALAPQAPGPRPAATTVTVDAAFIQRAIAVLATQRGSVRGIQLGLELLFQVSRSVGYISQTLIALGRRAMIQNATQVVPLPVLAEADEIFQGRQPCLTVVDGRSFLVLNLTPAAARDATTWGVTFLDLQARGIQFHDLASDGSTGIRAGAAAAHLAVPLRPDLFHLLDDAWRVGQRLERQAYQAMQLAERARRAAAEAQAAPRRRGPRLKVQVPLAEAIAQEAQAIQTYDLFVWLLDEVRQALEPLSGQGTLTAVTTARSTVETALALLATLPEQDVQALAQQLHAHLEALLAPLLWLEQTLAPYRQGLDPATEALILWAWQHRRALALTPGDGFPAHLRTTVQAFWTALSFFHRASSLAEALHSWLRPHLVLHRGLPPWLLPLLQLVWNHHAFSRGKRAGSSPLQLAGVSDAPTLAEAFDQLCTGLPVASSQPPRQYTLAEVFGLSLDEQAVLQLA